MRLDVRRAYVRWRINETSAFKTTQAANRVVRSLLREARASQKEGMGYRFALSAHSSLGFYALAGYFVSYLTTFAKVCSNQALISNCTALIVAATMLIFSDYLSDLKA